MYFHYLIILSPLGKGHGPSLKQTLIPFTQGCFLSNLVEIHQVVLEKKIFNFVKVFLLFPNSLPLEKAIAPFLNKLESPLPKDDLCQVLLNSGS